MESAAQSFPSSNGNPDLCVNVGNLDGLPVVNSQQNDDDIFREVGFEPPYCLVRLFLVCCFPRRYTCSNKDRLYNLIQTSLLMHLTSCIRRTLIMFLTIEQIIHMAFASSGDIVCCNILNSY